MTTTQCTHCRSTHTWSWPEAFDKFGFDDGDGLVMTDTVAAALHSAGYVATTEAWGFHNVIITSIKRGRRELIPAKACLGYDDPRDYLPKAIVALLDKAFAADAEVEL